MKTFIFMFTILFATMTTAMAGGLDSFRDKSVMAQLNQLLSGEIAGSGAACRTQAGSMRYLLTGYNIKAMVIQNDRINFKTKSGGMFSLPVASCDIYRNTKRS